MLCIHIELIYVFQLSKFNASLFSVCDDYIWKTGLPANSRGSVHVSLLVSDDGVGEVVVVLIVFDWTQVFSSWQLIVNPYSSQFKLCYGGHWGTDAAQSNQSKNDQKSSNLTTNIAPFQSPLLHISLSSYIFPLTVPETSQLPYRSPKAELISAYLHYNHTVNLKNKSYSTCFMFSQKIHYHSSPQLVTTKPTASLRYRHTVQAQQQGLCMKEMCEIINS